MLGVKQLKRQELQMKTKETGKKPNRTAVALSYDVDDKAPKIIASGKGYLADKIVNVASQKEIPIHKDDALVKSLSKLNIGDYIPPELYEIVAEILIYVDRVEQLKA